MLYFNENEAGKSNLLYLLCFMRQVDFEIETVANSIIRQINKFFLDISSHFLLPFIIVLSVARSSNGKTHGSGPCFEGSNPSLAAKIFINTRRRPSTFNVEG